MQNRLTQLFAKKPNGLLSVFYTAGFPKLDDTVPVGVALAQAGADLIEVGIPFSDPVADGPTIQESNKIALENGISVKTILQQVRALRSQVQIPIVLMGYLNPVLQYGMENFAKEAAAAGVDGLILPDMPLYDYERHYRQLFDDHNLSVIFLIAPTTSEERIRKIDEVSNAFIYAVSASSTTGATSGFGESQLQYFQRLQNMKLRNSFLIGFGISDRSTFESACNFGAGAIVGSAFIKSLQQATDMKATVGQFVKKLKP